eukprot:53798-Eustigmatos_ZCMA.PRE.1
MYTQKLLSVEQIEAGMGRLLVRTCTSVSAVFCRLTPVLRYTRTLPPAGLKHLSMTGQLSA